MTSVSARQTVDPNVLYGALSKSRKKDGYDTVKDGKIDQQDILKEAADEKTSSLVYAPSDDGTYFRVLVGNGAILTVEQVTLPKDAMMPSLKQPESAAHAKTRAYHALNAILQDGLSQDDFSKWFDAQGGVITMDASRTFLQEQFKKKGITSQITDPGIEGVFGSKQNGISDENDSYADLTAFANRCEAVREDYIFRGLSMLKDVLCSSKVILTYDPPLASFMKLLDFNKMAKFNDFLENVRKAYDAYEKLHANDDPDSFDDLSSLMSDLLDKSDHSPKDWEKLKDHKKFVAMLLKLYQAKFEEKLESDHIELAQDVELTDPKQHEGFCTIFFYFAQTNSISTELMPHTWGPSQDHYKLNADMLLNKTGEMAKFLKENAVFHASTEASENSKDRHLAPAQN